MCDKVNENSENTKWDVKLNFYDKLFETYRREIDCLWHRSVFLGTFLVLIFTGYGSLLKLLCENESSDWVIHLLLCGIAFLGVVLSVLWILMAKGSKAWQEVYEKKINIFEESFGICRIVSNGYCCNLFAVRNGGAEPKLLSRCSPYDYSNCIFSLKAGKYSVSKINICLGIVFYIVWGFLFCLHLIVLFVGQAKIKEFVSENFLVRWLKNFNMWWLFLLGILIVVGITLVITQKNKSGGFGK